MGCWNGTCAISNLHITHGTPVTVFMLLEQCGQKSYCYTNALNDICPVPFYGEYNDYGAVENCHGFALNMIVDGIRDQLYEFGQGPNSYHDMPVNKNNFNLEMLFDADNEDRLGIHQSYKWNDDEYNHRELQKEREENGLTESQMFELDRLATKIKKEDTFRRVTHVIVHGEIFKDIMEKWYINQYVGDGKGNKGYNNNYIHIYFKDILNDLPAYIEAEKRELESIAAEDNAIFRYALRKMRISRNYDSSNAVSRWLTTLSRSEAMNFGIINAEEVINDYKDNGDWEGLKLFLTEVLTTLWVNSFMSHTRKLWTKQCGAGSQNSDHLAYTILTQSMNDIMAAEQAEMEDDSD